MGVNSRSESSRLISGVAATIIGVSIALSGSAAVLGGLAVAEGDLFARANLADPPVPVSQGFEIEDASLTKVVPGGPAWTMGLRDGQKWTTPSRRTSSPVPSPLWPDLPSATSTTISRQFHTSRHVGPLTSLLWSWC